MSATESALVDHDQLPKAYLRPVLVVARSARRNEYVVVHLASGSFFRTDRLGAVTMRALIRGCSGGRAMEVVERIEAGAGERARQLICQLDSQHAMTLARPAPNVRRWLHRLAALAFGLSLDAVGPLVRVAPTAVLAWMFKIWPASPISRYVWRCSRPTVIHGLRASGYAGRTEEWLLHVGRSCTADATRNYLFNYVSVAVPARRLERLVDRLFDHDSLDELATQLQATGPVIGVFLHNPLCVAVPNALRARGHDAVRVVVPRTHGINVMESSGRLGDFFGESSEMAVEESGPNASGALLRHLAAGRSVHLALDKLPGEAKTAQVEMMGHTLARNDGPAWLAVQSGRPIALWATHNSPSGVVVTTSPLLYPDLKLPVKHRVAVLSQRLYAYAEAVIREHPEAWTLWTHPGFLAGNVPDQDGERVASKAAVALGR